MRFAPLLLASTLLAFVPSLALAQTPASPQFRLDAVQPASPSSPFLTVEGPTRPATSGISLLSASVLVSYARSPLTVHARRGDDMVQVATPVRGSLLVQPGLGLQLSQHFSGDVLLPIALAQSGDTFQAPGVYVPAPKQGTALGDLRVGGMYRAWVSDSVGIVVAARLWAPTGSSSAYMTDDRVRVELLAGGAWQPDPWRAACDFVVAPTFILGKRGDRVALGCALDRQILPTRTRAGLEVTAAAVTLDEKRAPGSLFQFWAALQQPIGPLRVTAAGGPEAGSSPGVAAWRLMASLSYAPQQPRVANAGRDSDLDGIADTDDRCPTEAGPRSDQPARNGCPNLDSDGDGVDDYADACPKEKGVRSEDPSENGCPDSDNDHILDKKDKCPHEPAQADPGDANLGCPKFAHLRGDKFVLSRPVRADAASPADDAVLSEIAFALRANMALSKVSVEVTLQGQDDDEALVERAADRAGQIVKRLVELGVDRDRLVPVGGVSKSPSSVSFAVVEKGPSPGNN